jgi:hypothetical protein
MEESLPSLHGCLAHVVLNDYETWLGIPSPSCLASFLDGAATRAILVGAKLPIWKVYRPLEEEEFYLPLVARTGRPTLSIKWPTALEIYHFSLANAMRELQELMRSWVQRHGLETKADVNRGLREPPMTLAEHMNLVARRPAMYLGENNGWALHCYLGGMDRGGGWLGLPPLPGLRQIVDGIEERSQKSYGSKFAAYRVYQESPSQLLSWVGIEAE